MDYPEITIKSYECGECGALIREENMAGQCMKCKKAICRKCEKKHINKKC